MSFLMPGIAMMDKILRSVVVNLFLLVSFRLAGQRLLGQLTAFDLVVFLIISNMPQNAAIRDDTSRGAGLLGAYVIIVLNSVAAWLTYRHKRRPRLVENVSTVLIRHGRVVPANLDREHMTMAERRVAPRKEGSASVSEVGWAILEEDGRISVIHLGAQPA